MRKLWQNTVSASRHLPRQACLQRLALFSTSLSSRGTAEVDSTYEANLTHILGIMIHFLELHFWSMIIA